MNILVLTVLQMITKSYLSQQIRKDSIVVRDKNGLHDGYYYCKTYL